MVRGTDSILWNIPSFRLEVFSLRCSLLTLEWCLYSEHSPYLLRRAFLNINLAVYTTPNTSVRLRRVNTSGPRRLLRPVGDWRNETRSCPGRKERKERGRGCGGRFDCFTLLKAYFRRIQEVTVTRILRQTHPPLLMQRASYIHEGGRGLHCTMPKKGSCQQAREGFFLCGASFLYNK